MMVVKKAKTRRLNIPVSKIDIDRVSFIREATGSRTDSEAVRRAIEHYADYLRQRDKG